MIPARIVMALVLSATAALATAADQEKLRGAYKRVAGKAALAEVPETHTFDHTEYKGAFSKGRIKTITVLDAEGVKDGIEVEKIPFGWRITRRTPWVKGERHGTEQEYAYVKGEDGKDQRVVVSEIPWNHGKIDGTKLSRHTNGQVQSEVPYVEGEPHGTSKTFDEEGRLIRKTIYVDGERHGETVEYHAETDEVKRRLPYVEGEIHGVVEEFYSNGQLKRRIPCKQGGFHGIEEEFASDGTLRNRRYWLDDERVDKATWEAKGE